MLSYPSDFSNRRDLIATDSPQTATRRATFFKCSADFTAARIPQSEDEILSKLPPLDRFRYLAKHNLSGFVILILALFGGIYMVASALAHFDINIFSSAFAQSSANAIAGQPRDMFEWYVAGMMGICLLVSLGMVVFSQTETKIAFGKDTTKMILGFVVGFLSGGKTR